MKNSSLSVFAIICSLFVQTASAATDGDYEYEINPDGATVTITGYTGAGGAVVIPNILGAKTVTKIAQNTFYMNNSLTSVIIPNSVIEIGTHVFGGCTLLESVNLGAGITKINDNAFASCTSLKNLTIHNNVKEIGEYSFFHCTSLTQIELPNSLIVIGDGAFADSALTNVTLPESLLVIRKLAFSSCRNLTSVTIPENVTVIEPQAFAASSALTSIEVVANNASYSDIDGVLFDKTQTRLIQYPIGLEASTYIIPESVTEILNRAFNNCNSLSSVTIPDSVTKLEGNAFSFCKKLTSVIIPASVIEIEYRAFAYCDSLTSVYIKGNWPIFDDDFIFLRSYPTIYYRKNSGWTSGESYGGLSTLLWDPLVQDQASDFGIQPDGSFSFEIEAEGIDGALVRVLASNDLNNWEEQTVINITSDDHQETYTDAQASTNTKRYYMLDMP